MNTAEYHHLAIKNSREELFNQAMQALLELFEMDNKKYYVEFFLNSIVTIRAIDDYNHLIEFLGDKNAIHEISWKIDKFGDSKQDLKEKNKIIEDRYKSIDFVFNDGLESESEVDKIVDHNIRLLLNYSDLMGFDTATYFREEFQKDYHLHFERRWKLRNDCLYTHYFKISKLRNFNYLIHMIFSKALYGFYLHDDDYSFIKKLNIDLFSVSENEPRVHIIENIQHLVFFDKKNRLNKESKNLLELNFRY